MQVVVAPDSFGGTLTATAAADAIVAGWRRAAPADTLVALPLADGGTGFADVLHAALGGTWHELAVTGPLGDPVAARWLEHGGTAYLESAAACGLHLVARERRTPDAAVRGTTRGVGELVADARDAGMAEIVVGLGGSATTDGGAGMLAALGAPVLDAAGSPLSDGAPDGATRFAGPVDLRGTRLVAAADVDNPLLGEHGAAAVFGPQKGADAATVARLDAALAGFADVLATLDVRAGAGRAGAERDGAERDGAERDGAEGDGAGSGPAGDGGGDMRDAPGAGAAGGLGAALLACGARRVSGAGLVRDLVGLDAALDAADLALTGEGSFDWQSLRGKLITAVARSAADRGIPCVVLAGQVSVGRREASAAGVEAAYSVADDAGGVDASLADPAGTLAALAERVAARWSR